MTGPRTADRTIPGGAPLSAQETRPIAAGEPVLTHESLEEIFPVPRELIGDGMLFVLKVTGDSMLNEAIISGDWVVVRQQSAAENGKLWLL